ncbi:MAG TPA: preprotein translocase subunit YajC [Acidimicrobiales bacterium]|nr:preprotein translocase subunit YajC [Acidimicrobiales bacterium]
MMLFGIGVAPLLAAAQAKKPSSSGSTGFFLVIIIIFAAVYFLILRPRQQQAKKTRDDMSTIDVGDEVVTIGGIVGRVVEMENDRVTIETGGDVTGQVAGRGEPTQLVMLRSAIARRTTPPAEPAHAVDDAPSDEHHDADGDVPEGWDHDEDGRK